MKEFAKFFKLKLSTKKFIDLYTVPDKKNHRDELSAAAMAILSKWMLEN